MKVPSSEFSVTNVNDMVGGERKIHVLNVSENSENLQDVFKKICWILQQTTWKVVKRNFPWNFEHKTQLNGRASRGR